MIGEFYPGFYPKLIIILDTVMRKYIVKWSKSFRHPNRKKRRRERWIGKERERDLVDSSADELAAENNVTKQDGEIAAWLWVLRLLIQHEPCYCHQVRPVCLRRVIHFPPLLFFSLFSPSLSKHLGAPFEVKLRVYIYIYIYIYLSVGKESGTQERNLSEWGQMRWDEMIWWGYLIFISAVNGSFGGHVADLEWREWASGRHCCVRITSFVVFFSWSALFVHPFPSCNQ